MTVSNGYSLTALSSVKFIQCSGSFKRGEGKSAELPTGISLYIPIIFHISSLSFLYALVFPYIFLLFDCFKWALIDRIVKCKVHLVLWQFQVGGNLKIYPGKSENGLLVLNTLVFPYIFLLFDCFEWVLIDRIVKCKVHSVLWQFWGGVNLKIYLGKSENELLVLNTLLFSYTFLLFDCFKWVLIDIIVKCKVHLVLYQFHWGGKSKDLPG